jgi:hypothetical protein
MIRTIVWGLIVAAIGLWIWLGNLEIIRQIRFGRDWPVIIIIIGLLTIAEGISYYIRRKR